jgi:hypothetical protein
MEFAKRWAIQPTRRKYEINIVIEIKEKIFCAIVD